MTTTRLCQQHHDRPLKPFIDYMSDAKKFLIDHLQVLECIAGTRAVWNRAKLAWGNFFLPLMTAIQPPTIAKFI